MNYILVIKNCSNVFFFVISRFHYLFNKSLEIKNILWKKIKFYVPKQTAVLVVLTFLQEQKKCSWGITHFFQCVKSHANIYEIISDMIFHRKVGHAKSSIRNPDLPVRGRPFATENWHLRNTPDEPSFAGKNKTALVDVGSSKAQELERGISVNEL